MIETKSTVREDRREKAVLVKVLLSDGDYSPDDPLEEIRGLVKSAGLIVAGGMLQKRHQVDIATYIGSGKVNELKELVEAHEADLVVFDNDLGPAQTRNLEKLLGVKVIDRTEVILDIFATRARTHEAHLQVELAQLEYALPRLKRMWTHLSRYKGGIGVRGPGEKQLEEDRRLVTKRIRDLKEKLGKVESRREREVAGRGDVATVGLVGYTNAGKSRPSDQQALTRAPASWPSPHACSPPSTPKTPSAGSFRSRRKILPLRHRRLHPRPAALPRRVVQGDPRGSPPGRPAPPRRRRVLPRRRVADPGGQYRFGRARPRPAADDPGPEQGRPRRRPVDHRDVLKAHHDESITISASSGMNLDRLEQAVREVLNERALDAEVETGVGNGRVLSYLAQHANIKGQTYLEDRVLLQCRLPRRCLDFLNEHGARVRTAGERVIVKGDSIISSGERIIA